VGVAEDIVISMVVFLFLSLRNTDGTVFQGANSVDRWAGLIRRFDIRHRTAKGIQQAVLKQSSLLAKV
jgi:hypothetical protein